MQGDLDTWERWLQDESFVNWAFHTHAGDIDKWEQWLAENPGYRQRAEKAKAMLCEMARPGEVPPAQSRQALTRLLERLNIADKVEYLGTKRPHRSLRRYALPVAATIALLISTAALVYWQVYRPAEVLLSTGFGEKQEITLPDQTEVILNANSTLRYAQGQPREVWLEGEAFFKVKKQPLTGARFIVHTPDLAVEVLGTAFNVNSRRAQTQVFLEEGRVSLSLRDSARTPVSVLPGELVTYSSGQGGEYQKVKVQPELLTSWRDGVIELKMTSLHEVILRMEEVYGISIRVDNDELAQRKINVVIPIEELPIALQQIAYALSLNINQVNDSTYVIE